ncbi:hypothetical protein [Bradyrhizobium erythrophlei]|uniref:Uncharacterized protein n=1 Tax=Bradyrhizobium erythrophlei TaxID=1437360 RepID=A0A1H4YKU5_9BRAD|nr:hypothetical protein [Bradyrhizobium erythrophlei]SED18602.1 hypothetical protein SAMN05444164_3999 [Bradyrhizobium erythrophlei]
MQRLGRGQAAILVTLVLLLALTVVLAATGWNSAESVQMTSAGWLAMGFGIFFSLLIGCGLMALMFYSSRSGYDEAADPFRDPRENASDGPRRPTDRPDHTIP